VGRRSGELMSKGLAASMQRAAGDQLDQQVDGDALAGLQDATAASLAMSDDLVGNQPVSNPPSASSRPSRERTRSAGGILAYQMTRSW
jgi:hypothetical protein